MPDPTHAAASDFAPATELAVEFKMSRGRLLNLISTSGIPGGVRTDRAATSGRWFASRIGVRHRIDADRPEDELLADGEALRLIIDQRTADLASWGDVTPPAFERETIRRYRLLLAEIEAAAAQLGGAEWTPDAS